MRTIATLAALAALSGKPLAVAQNAGHAHGAHAVGARAATPTEAGQGGFAAIAEIVAMLSADPATDWRRVNIDALRAHLVDMELVTTATRVARENLADGARFRVSGQGEAAEAARRMTVAHAPFLEAEDAWSVVAEPTDDGAILTVRAEDAALVAKIQGLGYFGLMALGAHHQAHHLAMALGEGHGQDHGPHHGHGAR